MKLAKTTARGLGWQHQKRRLELIESHNDGEPCYWCGLPMWKDATRNWDERPLEADHVTPRSVATTPADRLLHQWCNRKRGAGENDHRRPSLTGEPMHRKIIVITKPRVTRTPPPSNI